MKSLKVLFIALFVVALAGIIFAFSSQSESVAAVAKRTVVFYEYIGVQPTTAASLLILLIGHSRY